MNKKEFEEFDWSRYENNYQGSNKLVSNLKIKGQDNNSICYSREPYAQEIFDMLSSNDHKVVNKDLVKGDCVSIASIYNIKDNKLTVELVGGLTVDVDLNREKRFVKAYGYDTIEEFIKVLSNEDTLIKFIDQNLFASVIEASPTIKISLWQGHIKKTKNEFMDEVKSPSRAYIAKIYEANKGGFFVEVQGVEAFMPGSLAAPNKIMDFQSYVGKEIIVMIEDYLKDMNSFIVSHKKYIEHVLPKKISELDLDDEHKGLITGTSKYGIFVEFKEIFTGLLHYSKMKEETLVKFKKREFKPGDEIKFFINEITKDNRIILSEESRLEKREKLKSFLDENANKVIEGNVAAIMTFGLIVNVGEMSGLIPFKEFKKNKMSLNNFIIGDKIPIEFKELNEDKIVFGLFFEKKEI